MVWSLFVKSEGLRSATFVTVVISVQVVSLVPCPISRSISLLTLVIVFHQPLDVLISESSPMFREKAREMFYHGFESYMEYAFPLDELKPLSCEGRKPEKRGTLDDIIGKYVQFFED